MTDAIAHGAFHPSGKLYRFTILFFVSIIIYGSYFAYDTIGALAPLIIKGMGIGREQIGMLYSFYSWPNVIMVFFGGMLIDRIGTRKASLVFSGLVTFGAAMVAIAPSFGWMLVGRVLFGIGSESLIVAQSAIIARWFKGKELALAFGIALTVSRIGTLFSFNGASIIGQQFGGYKAALWAAVILCLVSLAANLVYIFMDIHGDKMLKLEAAGSGDKIVLSDIKKFGASFWFVTLLCVTFYSAIFPYTAFSTDFIHDKWGLPLTMGDDGGLFSSVFNQFAHLFNTAGGTTSIIITASMFLAPFLGNFVDKFGRRGTFMIIGSLMLVPSYLILGLTHVPPMFPMIAIGLAFSLVPAAMWPSIPLIVAKERVGTAYGLMTMVQNLGLATFPWIIGAIRDAAHDYTICMYVFASLGIFGFVFAILLKRADAKAGHQLERVG